MNLAETDSRTLKATNCPLLFSQIKILKVYNQLNKHIKILSLMIAVTLMLK